jgi:thymidylate synthase ThyX
MKRQKKPKSQSIETLLVMLVDQFNQLNAKIDTVIELSQSLLKLQKESLPSSVKDYAQRAEFKIAPDVMSLLSLPASLRKTAMVLYKREEATAADLASETKRMRAVESAAANQLVRMGYLKKRREGRDVLFYVEPLVELIK